MYRGGVTFSISKSFGRLQLIPEPLGLRFYYTPVVDGSDNQVASGNLDMLLPIDAIGGLWVTARAFLLGLESLDESVVLMCSQSAEDSDAMNDESLINETTVNEAMVKLYRDKPRGQQGRLSGDETCWLRIVTGKTEEERRRIKLGARDLLCIELACNSVMVLAGREGAHRPSLHPEMPEARAL